MRRCGGAWTGRRWPRRSGANDRTAAAPGEAAALALVEAARRCAHATVQSIRPALDVACLPGRGSRPRHHHHATGTGAHASTNAACVRSGNLCRNEPCRYVRDRYRSKLDSPLQAGAPMRSRHAEFRMQTNQSIQDPVAEQSGDFKQDKSWLHFSRRQAARRCSYLKTGR